MSIRDQLVRVLAEGYRATVGSEHTDPEDWYDEANSMADRLLARFLVIDPEDAQAQERGARSLASSMDKSAELWPDWIPEVERFFDALKDGT